MRKLKNASTKVAISVGNLWRKCQRTIKQTVLFVWKVVKNTVKKFIKIDIMFFVAGIIINAIICKIFPKFPEGFPVLYGWFNGWVQFNLFVIKSVVNGMYSIFTGDWKEFWEQLTKTFREMIAQFVSWVNNIKI